MTFDDFSTTYYYWDLEGSIGTNSIKGYHDYSDSITYYGEGWEPFTIDGLTSLTLVTDTLLYSKYKNTLKLEERNQYLEYFIKQDN